MPSVSSIYGDPAGHHVLLPLVGQLRVLFGIRQKRLCRGLLFNGSVEDMSGCLLEDWLSTRAQDDCPFISSFFKAGSILIMLLFGRSQGIQPGTDIIGLLYEVH